jgi:hypothetical protein
VEPRRLSRGDWIAAIGGVVMLIALFLPWYSAGGQSVSAWEAMALDDVILAITALLAIGAAVIVGIPRLLSVSVATTSLAILPAVVGLLLTIYRLVSPAPEIDVSLEVGAWLGLAATASIAYGAWTGANDEGPARRRRAAEDRAVQEALARAELLKLPAESSSGGATPAGT